MSKISIDTIKSKLEEVMDPELNMSIIDLGLVYKVSVNSKGVIKIVMTLTTIGCPLFSLIEEEVKSKMKEIGINENQMILELTFDPPWSMERMTPRAKAMLGI